MTNSCEASLVKVNSPAIAVGIGNTIKPKTKTDDVTDVDVIATKARV